MTDQPDQPDPAALAALLAREPAEPELRVMRREDLAALQVLDARAFNATWEEDDFAGFERIVEPERFLVAVEPGVQGPDALVGSAGSYPFTMTLPGGPRLAVPGVTWVAVALHQRRRGLLRRMFGRLHRDLVDEGAALAVLTASEGGIYGRFGYGHATTNRSVKLDRRRARLSASAEALAGPVPARPASPTAARAHLASVHERWCAVTPGALTRSSAWWDWLLADTPTRRGGASELFALVHADGYALYRVHDEHTARVIEVTAAAPAAHAALWRALLALDLVTDITSARAVPLDDPLPLLLTEYAAVATTAVEDGVWVRLLDVPAALAARRYSCEVDVVIDVRDGGLLDGVDAAARVRLRGGPDGATCERTDAVADVRLGVAALGAAHLGGTRLGVLARAGRVEADDPAALARLGAALAGEREPQYGTGF